MAPKLVHSHSALDMFDSCPKKYYHLRVAKDVKAEDGPESLVGKLDHKSLEDRIKSGIELPPHLIKHEDKCKIILNSGFEIKTEEELAVTRELVPCDWWHQDVWLRVKADVALYSETTAAVLDWKTGKQRPKPFQLELGSLTQFIHYPKIKSTKAAFLWLKEDTSNKYTYTRDDDFERIHEKLERKVERIEETAADGVWQAKPGYHCNWCEARHICSYSQAKD